MLLYEDVITGDELFSDAFPLFVVYLAQFPSLTYPVIGSWSTISRTRLTAKPSLSSLVQMSISVSYPLGFRYHIFLKPTRCQPLRRGARRGRRGWLYSGQQRRALIQTSGHHLRQEVLPHLSQSKSYLCGLFCDLT